MHPINFVYVYKLVLSISISAHRYRNRSLQLKNRKAQKLYKKKFNTISIYAQNIVEALWYDEVCKYDTEISQ